MTQITSSVRSVVIAAVHHIADLLLTYPARLAAVVRPIEEKPCRHR